MIYKVKGQQPFQILSDNFSISPATEAYILQVSADGVDYTDLFAVAAGVTRMITGVAAGSFYRLKNNIGEVSVNWRKSCGGGGGEGDAYALKPSASLPLSAEEGTLMATEDGIYQFIGGAWVEAGGSFDPDEVRKIVKEEIEPLEERVEDLEEDVKDIDKRIDEVEETTSIALNDLNTRVNEKTTEQWVKDQEYLTEPDLKTINGKSIVGTGNIDIQSQSFILEIEEKMVSTDVYVYEMTDAVEQADALNKYFVKNGETAPVIVKFTDKYGDVTVFDVDKRNVDIASKLLCHFYTEKLYIEISGNGDIDAETGHLSKVTSVDVDIKDQSKHLVEEDLKTVNGESLVGTGDVFVPDGAFVLNVEKKIDASGDEYFEFPEILKQTKALYKYIKKNGETAPIFISYLNNVIIPNSVSVYNTSELNVQFLFRTTVGGSGIGFIRDLGSMYINLTGNGTEFDSEGHMVEVTSAYANFDEVEKDLVESDLKTINGESIVGTGDIEIEVGDAMFTLALTKDTETGVYGVEDADLVALDKFFTEHRDKSNILFLEQNKVPAPGLIPPYTIHKTGYLDKAFARIAPTGEVWTLNRSYRFYTNRFEVAFRVSGKKDETSVVLDKTIVDRTLATEKWVEDQEYITEPDLKTLNGESLVGTGNIEIVIPLAKDDYDALPEAKKKEENVAYFVQDDDDAVEVLFTDKLVEGMKDKLTKIMLDSLYPIGSYSLGVKPNIGTWEEVVGDRALWIKNTVEDGTTIEQALPNITGAIRFNSEGGIVSVDGTSYAKGALKTGDGLAYTFATSGTGNPWIKNNLGKEIALDASNSSSVYQNGANVQPNAYVIKVYKRIA